MKQPKNLVGPQVVKLRTELGLSQEELAAKAQRQGWDISRDIVARIEGQIRVIPDRELHKLAKVLGVKIQDLFPKDKLPFFH